jgi:hypothetical protein
MGSPAEHVAELSLSPKSPRGVFPASVMIHSGGATQSGSSCWISVCSIFRWYSFGVYLRGSDSDRMVPLGRIPALQDASSSDLQKPSCVAHFWRFDGKLCCVRTKFISLRIYFEQNLKMTQMVMYMFLYKSQVSCILYILCLCPYE